MHQMNQPKILFDSMSQVYETYHPLACRFAYTLSPNDAEDIADKVMSQLEKKLFLNPSSPISKSLVIKMVHQRFREKWRKDKMKRSKRNELGRQFQKRHEILSPQEQLQKVEELDRLRWAIDKLDFESQGLVRLYLTLADENKHVSYRLMARVCQKAQWTVKNKLEEIFTRLAIWMSEYCEEKER